MPTRSAWKFGTWGLGHCVLLLTVMVYEPPPPNALTMNVLVLVLMLVTSPRTVSCCPTTGMGVGVRVGRGVGTDVLVGDAPGLAVEAPVAVAPGVPPAEWPAEVALAADPVVFVAPVELFAASAAEKDGGRMADIPANTAPAPPMRTALRTRSVSLLLGKAMRMLPTTAPWRRMITANGCVFPGRPKC